MSTVSQELWPTYGKTCNICQKAAKCHSKVRGSQRYVRALDSDDADKVFLTEVSTVHLDDSWYVLESGNYLRFYVDTGAQCNVIFLTLCRKATIAFNFAQVIPVDTTMTTYGGSTFPVVGKVLVCVWRGEFKCKLVLVGATNV